ncbi:MAG: hypothetical protein NTY38_32730 [Acidobacteria bacterium]|nr:hypothetical protein [Acidobacteriota bacterium]
MLNLDLHWNAMHTLYHAVEHMYWSESQDDARDGHSYNHDEHTVEWRNERGRLCFALADYTRLPVVYSLKFALLHLIQAAELILKAYVQRTEPEAVFQKPGSKRTINLRKALDFTVEHNPTLLSRSDIALLLEAKDLRDRVEHYEFGVEERGLRGICADFLGVCSLLAQALLAISIADAFSWDYLRDKPDKVADYLSTVLNSGSSTGLQAARRSGELWTSSNPDHPVFLCLNCGARAVSVDRGICMGCGAAGDEEIVGLMEDLEAAGRKVMALQKLLDPSAKSFRA